MSEMPIFRELFLFFFFKFFLSFFISLFIYLFIPLFFFLPSFSIIRFLFDFIFIVSRFRQKFAVRFAHSKKIEYLMQNLIIIVISSSTFKGFLIILLFSLRH